jgi:hypothetical protein
MARAFVWLLPVLVVLGTPRAHAQINEAAGIRAQGMAGAFTAVADDASAAWWNPAGLANGPYFSAILEATAERQPADRTALPAWRLTSRGVSMAYPALGLSYYHLRVSEIHPIIATAEGAAGRQDGGTADVRLRSLVFDQFGATVGQSLGQHVVVASTLKLLSGGAAGTVRPKEGSSIDAAGQLEVERETHGALDLGAMARFGGATVGVIVRNVSAPTFGSGADAFVMERQIRAGVAFGSGRRPSSMGLTLAADVDLTTVTTATGDERRFAAGAEASLSRRLGLRGGVSINTVNEVQPSVSGGISLGLRSGTFLDAQMTGGPDAARRGLSSGLRVTF